MGQAEQSHLKNARLRNPDKLRKLFPLLDAAGFRLTSDRDPTYNCIAWAAHEDDRWWCPHFHYWPIADRSVTKESFIKAFETLGYSVTGGYAKERGWERVAIYTVNGLPAHMARQRADGIWTSKCGDLEDIDHYTLDGLRCHGKMNPVGTSPLFQANYGDPEIVMRRPTILGWIVRTKQWVGRQIRKRKPLP
jgi:hypothetical protein